MPDRFLLASSQNCTRDQFAPEEPGCSNGILETFMLVFCFPFLFFPSLASRPFLLFPSTSTHPFISLQGYSGRWAPLQENGQVYLCLIFSSPSWNVRLLLFTDVCVCRKIMAYKLAVAHWHICWPERGSSSWPLHWPYVFFPTQQQLHYLKFGLQPGGKCPVPWIEA